MAQKIFNNDLFRTLATWFAEYVKEKFQTAQAWVTIINVSTDENVKEINDFFAANPDINETTVTQQWHGESAPQEHTVYRYIVYIGGVTL